MTAERSESAGNNAASPFAVGLLVVASGLLGGGSLLLLLAFLFAGPLHLVDLGLGDRATLAFDAVLSLVFFLQHSSMTRGGFRIRLSRLVRAEYHAAVYSAASGVVLLVVLVLWQETTATFGSVRGGAWWALRGLFLLSVIGFAWGTRALGPFDSFGLRAIRRLRSGKPLAEPRFAVRGPYRWVRHPLYFFALVLFWAAPDLTADRLLFNVLWTLWVWVGTILEERDLVATFGEPYREYRRRVPMLVPYRLLPLRPSEPPS
jgi:hypothetical protein